MRAAPALAVMAAAATVMAACNLISGVTDLEFTDTPTTTVSVSLTGGAGSGGAGGEGASAAGTGGSGGAAGGAAGAGG
jgi:hypothetical protein